jgi:hypothetical protein
MGRYLVTWKGQPSSLDSLEEGSRNWQEVLTEFPEITCPYTFGNLSEGIVTCVLEAPSADMIRELNQRLGERMAEKHPKFREQTESAYEYGIDILPLEFEIVDGELIYQHELVRVKI